ncbi:MAG: glycoside hydrolase family 2 protein [Clostridia bacterium]|nr:glycoside hydrolase family 2 protein [Clostridia bacterium]
MKRYDILKWTLKGENVSPLQVSVPSDVTDELFKAGLISDPLFGKNPDGLTWIANGVWIYESVFDLPKEICGKKRINLCFDGVDTLAEITLNGVEIGKTDNMFLQYSYGVKDILKEKDNVLQVKFLSATEDIRKKNDGKNYRALFTQDRLWIRKAQCHWGWDWAPCLPGIGIWLPVYLQADDGVLINHVKVSSDVQGNVSFFVTLYNNGNHLFENEDEKYKIKIEIDGRKVYHTVSGLINVINVKIENPKLWWPNGYGEQNLYPYSVELEKDGNKVDEKGGEIGIRQILLEQKPIDQNRIGFAVKVNGRKIFCKGSNWVPISSMTGAIEDSSYQTLLQSAKDCNYNMLRVWGGGVYEKDIFYNLCDRLGIMVWQDFMFSCSAIPAHISDVKDSFLKEAEYQIKRLQNHPSIVLWCGGNEYMPHVNGSFYTEGNYLIRVILRGLCSELDGDRVYVHNSPVGLDDDEWHFTNGDAHLSCMDEVFNKEKINSFRRVISSRTSNFISESAHLGPTRLRSIRKFIPKEEIWPTGDSWEYHFLKNPYSPIKATCLDKEKFFASQLFGDYDTVEGFLKKAMLAHAEFMRAEMDFARSTPYCRGFMNWMYNDIWGCGTWSVIDYYGEKKPVYYAMKRCFAPVYIPVCEMQSGIRASVVNDTKTMLDGELICKSKTLDGEVLSEKKFCVSVEKDGVFSVDLENSDCDYTSFEYYADGKSLAKTIYFPKLWKDKKFVTNIKWDVVEKDENTYLVTVKANDFARSVFIDLKDNDGVSYSDNFFDMEKGDCVVVTVKSKKKLEKDDFSVKTFADEWED